MEPSKQKSSPLTGPPRRQAGHELRRWLSEEWDWYLVHALSSLFTLAVVITVVWLSWVFDRPNTPRNVTLTGLSAIVVYAFGIRKRLPESRAKQAGLRGELETAEWLEELTAMGYRVFHDLQSETPDGRIVNIDHAAVGPAGVLVIETKFRSKAPGDKVEYDGSTLRVGGRDESRALFQARMCRDDVRQRLRKEGLHDVPVRAVVVFPGWFVKDVPTAEVWVLNPKRMVAVRTAMEENVAGPCAPASVSEATRYLDRWARSE